MSQTTERNSIELDAAPIAKAVINQTANTLGKLTPKQRKIFASVVTICTELRLEAVTATPSRLKEIQTLVAAQEATLASLGEALAARAILALRSGVRIFLRTAIDVVL